MSHAEQPNILLIFTDQHKLSAVGCYGETPCQTPNLDRLAREGVRFETAYTVCPVCSPARATIMTGQYPHIHGVCSNVHNLGCSVHELTDRPHLLSRRLQAAGYRCGYSGKWHLGTHSERAFGSANRPTLPNDVGFKGQNFPGHGGGGFGYPEYKQYLAEHGWEHVVTRDESRPVASGGGLLQGPIESTVPYFLAQHTIDQIDSFHASGQPFFIWHNFWGPHGPYFATEAYYNLYRDVEIPEWPNYRWPSRQINRPHQVKIHPEAESFPWEAWAESIRYYYAFTTMIDAQIGRILDHLDRTGLSENTVVIFTADHGETLGTHGGLTDKGWHHFEEIQRIPFIVRLPEWLRPTDLSSESVEQAWVSLLDVYPTILDYAGISLPTDALQGRSLRPLLRGETNEWRDRVVVEFNGVNSLATSMVTLRVGDLKYGWNGPNWDELYDLSVDPYETRNLIHEPAYMDRAEKMRTQLGEWMQQTRYPGRQMYMRSRRVHQ